MIVTTAAVAHVCDLRARRSLRGATITSRRHDSLIPLSHQHQHALALAVIIRRRFGMDKPGQDWVTEMAAKTGRIYTAELAGHFEVEEGVLFPEMERYLGPLELVGTLLDEHQSLRGLVKAVEASPSLTSLDAFAALIESHVRKEERQLFPEFEKRMPAAEALRLGREIDSRLMKVCPRL